MHLCQLNRASFYRVTSSGITVRMSNRSPVPDEPLGHRGTHGRMRTHTHTHIRMYTCVHTSTVCGPLSVHSLTSCREERIVCMTLPMQLGHSWGVIRNTNTASWAGRGAEVRTKRWGRRGRGRRGRGRSEGKVGQSKLH